MHEYNVRRTLSGIIVELVREPLAGLLYLRRDHILFVFDRAESSLLRVLQSRILNSRDLLIISTMKLTASLALAFASTVLADGTSAKWGGEGEPQTYGQPPAGYSFPAGAPGGEQGWSSSTPAAPPVYSTTPITSSNVVPGVLSSSPLTPVYTSTRPYPIYTSRPGESSTTAVIGATTSTGVGTSYTSSEEALKTYQTSTETPVYTTSANVTTPTKPASSPVSPSEYTGAAATVEWTKGASLLALMGFIVA